MTNNIVEILNEILQNHSGYSIAKKIGVSPSQINRLKNGEYKILNTRLDLILKLLDAYADVSIKLKSE